MTATIQRQAAFARQQAASRAAAVQLADAVQAAESVARNENWSQRRLAAKLGFDPRTWRRMRNLALNAAVWLPKLRPAVAALNLV